MKKGRLGGLAAILLLAGSTLAAVPAFACSSRPPPALADLVAGETLPGGHPDATVVGVYEFEYLARSPRLLISGPRAVTIVTRYWGEPPAHVGLEITGTDQGLWSTSNCGDLTEPAGTLAYWYADARSNDDRGDGSNTLDGTQGGLTAAQAALLEERFGPPVLLGVTFADRAIARFQLWKWHLLGVVVVGVGASALRRRRKNLPAVRASTTRA